MKAAVGDRVVVRSPHVDKQDREGEIIDVRTPDGSPPFMVRWSDDGHESLFFPGPDCSVHRGDQTG
jgi:hypothetical protein